MTKKSVFYTECYFCNIGVSAVVVPTNHPEEGLRGIINGLPVRTSTVVSIIEPADKPIFETLNTIYSPIEKWQKEADEEAQPLHLHRPVAEDAQ